MLKRVLKRLKKPTVIISIASQVVALMILLDIKVDEKLITGVVMIICNILVLMGIMSNPDAEEDIIHKENDSKNSESEKAENIKS